MEFSQGQGPFSQPAPDFRLLFAEAGQQEGVARFQAVGLELFQLFGDLALFKELQGIFPPAQLQELVTIIPA